jgi:hypothetical protein
MPMTDVLPINGSLPFLGDTDRERNGWMDRWMDG